MNSWFVAALTEAVRYTEAGCALMQLARHTNAGLDLNLTQIAVRHGASVAEAEGVMDGWDEAAGGYGCFKTSPRGADDLLEYQAGYRLGRRLFVDASQRYPG